MRPLVIVGAGGFGRECHDVVVAMNEVEPTWDFLGFVDDQQPAATLMERRRANWLGTLDEMRGLRGASFVVGIGDAAIRERLADRASAEGLKAAVLVHPSATFGLDVEIGPGTVVCSHASVTTNVRIGRHVHIDQNVTVGHDCRVADFARLNPSATISGNVRIGRSGLVGANSTVIQGLQVGEAAVVGAGAVVTRDVPAGSTVVGVPARDLSPPSEG